MRNVLLIASKEIQESLRNRWVLATTLLLAALALTLTLLGSAPTGSVGVRPLDVVIVSLSSLSVFLLPLIALLISHDAIVGEIERGTMLLLLSYPVGRWQVLLGKFAGHLAVLAFATILGYGVAVMVLATTGAEIDADSLKAFGILVASSILLGAVFIAIGYLISSLVRERATAAGIAIGVWLAFVVLYDMGLLGLLVVDQGRNISTSMLDVLLLANPTDVYRMLTLAGTTGVSAFAGLAGLSSAMTLGETVLVAALLLWILSAAVARRARLLAEGTMNRLALLLLIAAILAGCGPKTATPTPPPFPLTAQAIGHYCGMNLLEHKGPKGQIILASQAEPIWFSSARDAFSFTMLQDEPKDIRAVYVSDMGKAPSWDNPGATNWVEAHKAFFVIDSTKHGGMGAPETVPFSEPRGGRYIRRCERRQGRHVRGGPA